MKEYILKVFDKEEYAKKFLETGEMKFTSNLVWHKYPDEFRRRDENEGLVREIFALPEEHFDKDITEKEADADAFFFDETGEAPRH